MRKKVLGIMLALALTAVFILACGEASTTATTVNGTVTSAPQAKHFKVGEHVKIGTWIVTGNGATTSAGDDFGQPKNGQYLILDLRLKNTDNATDSISSLLQFQFQDSTGQKYDIHITGLSGVTAPDGDVQAGARPVGRLFTMFPRANTPLPSPSRLTSEEPLRSGISRSSVCVFWRQKYLWRQPHPGARQSSNEAITRFAQAAHLYSC